MPKIERSNPKDPGLMRFHCPGCDEKHYIRTAPPPNPDYPGGKGRWKFNDDFEKPTISPSILVHAGHYTWKDGRDPKECLWCQDPDQPFGCYICHSFVTDGNIKFLNDCTHALAGKTVPLEDIN